jgi:hypothetical protein
MSSELLHQFIRSGLEPEASEQFDESRVRPEHFELPVRFENHQGRAPLFIRSLQMFPTSLLSLAGEEAGGVPRDRIVFLRVRINHGILEVRNLPAAIAFHQDE